MAADPSAQPGRGRALEAMEAEHRAIVPAIDALTAAA